MTTRSDDGEEYASLISMAKAQMKRNKEGAGKVEREDARRHYVLLGSIVLSLLSFLLLAMTWRGYDGESDHTLNHAPVVQPDQVHVTTYNAHLPLIDRLQCFAHRFTYHCDEQAQRDFIRRHEDEFLQVEELIRNVSKASIEHFQIQVTGNGDSSATAANSTTTVSTPTPTTVAQEARPFHHRAMTKDVLVIGNSHAGSIGEALICAFRASTVHFAGTDLYNGCMMSHPSWTSPNKTIASCDSGGNDGSQCGIYLATSTLQWGSRLHVAKNHPWLFGGPDHLTAAFDHMHIRPSDLGLIVLGAWNPSEWAAKYFGNADRDKQGRPPIPQMVPDFVDTKGNLREYSRCGGGYNVSDKTLLENISTQWQTYDVLQYFADHGFTGNVLVGNVNQNPENAPELKYSRKKTEGYPFDLYKAHWPSVECNVPHCTGHPSHSCQPGEPFLFLKQVMEHVI